MPLQRQLWIAIASLLLMVFSGTFLMAGVSTSRYLSEQLSIKNSDEATALALSLSQQTLTKAELEVQLAAQLDLGAYTRIAVIAPDGEELFARRRSFAKSGAPALIERLFPIAATAGRAEISSGWTPLGTLILESHTGFAYLELWALAQRMGLALVVAILVAGVLAALILRSILKPLHAVVAQAEALGDRRFERQPLPATREFAAVTGAMNTLTDRVEAMLTTEAQRLAARQVDDENDALTGILGRRAFMARLHSTLGRETEEAAGSVAILRIRALIEMNREYGREVVDNALKSVGQSLLAWGKEDPAFACARLNGSDFAVLAPREDHPERIGNELRTRVAATFKHHELAEGLSLPAAAVYYAPGHTATDLLTRLDAALSIDRGELDATVTVGDSGNTIERPGRAAAQAWRKRLTRALLEDRCTLEYFPVIDAGGKVLHEEGMLRLRSGGNLYTGAHILPWANRLSMSGDVDSCVIGLGAGRCLHSDTPCSVSLSVAALQQPEFMRWLQDQLAMLGERASLLAVEVEESTAFDHPAAFCELRDILRVAKAGLGLKNVGHRLAQLDLIARLGPDYLKIDRMYVHDVEATVARRQMLETFAAIARNLGVPCIAEGVASRQERDAAFACGVSAVTGPGVRG
ncbi:MAG: EAL domain-containing protein [Pseudomonadota bacterium]